ncbi:hypothetical protein Val02_81450 [Virgisporangium aliadipatigenens]|uniref:TVP38/TMEM64 family membrane protein n=1 Tax=Virgisporangium aliadipatigenens TaxID=741659 RepID=A0A8J3YSX1_9ACTN|nr:hypothetical protein Val02_81450 [Virgisporangium aliadipatigenens]
MLAARPTAHGLRFAALVALVIALFGGALAAGPDKDALLLTLRSSTVFAPLAVVVGSAVLVAAMVPRTLLALVGGAIFGTWSGSAYVLLGVTAGATMAYVVGRFLGRGYVAMRLRGRLALIEAWVARHGVWAVVVSRMIPMIPFAVSNYAFGTTSVRARQFITGTILGALPATLAYAALGSATVHQNWLGTKIAGTAVVILGIGGTIGTYLVWRRHPRVSLTKVK